MGTLLGLCELLNGRGKGVKVSPGVGYWPPPHVVGWRKESLTPFTSTLNKKFRDDPYYHVDPEVDFSEETTEETEDLTERSEGTIIVKKDPSKRIV